MKDVIETMINVRLNEYLKENGNKMSLRLLSEHVGVSREQLRRFASNEMLSLPVELLDKLCIYFECSVEDLVEHQPTEKL